MSSSNLQHKYFRVFLCLAGPAQAATRGTGGWAATVVWDEETQRLSGSFPGVTTNQLALYAAIEVLERIPVGEHVQFFTNNKYFHDCVTQWIKKWREKGWEVPIKYHAEWQKLGQLDEERDIEWIRFDNSAAPNEFMSLRRSAAFARDREKHRA